MMIPAHLWAKLLDDQLLRRQELEEYTETLPPERLVEVYWVLRDELALKDGANRIHDLQEDLMREYIDVEPVVRERIIVQDRSRDLEQP